MSGPAHARPAKRIFGGVIEKLTYGDFDGDGRQDIVAAHFHAQRVSFFRNTSTVGSVSLDTRLDLPCSDKNASLGVADLDGDGRFDVVLNNAEDGTHSVTLFRNTSSIGVLSFMEEPGIPLNSRTEMLQIMDLDEDGKKDIVVSRGTSNLLTIFRNLSTAGMFAFAPGLDFTTDELPGGIAIAASARSTS